jgi:hypothetical protein
MDKVELDEITKGIIGAAHQVSNMLGVGFIEKVYENAHEMRKDGLIVVQHIQFGTPKARIRRLHPSPTWKTQTWKYAKR